MLTRELRRLSGRWLDVPGSKEHRECHCQPCSKGRCHREPIVHAADGELANN